MPVPSYELVTPGWPTAWLRRNTNNRHKRIARIERLAQKLAGDGRSRIRASPSAPTERCTTDSTGWRPSSAAAWPWWMLVVLATSPESQRDIDTGEKRLTNDNLAIVDGTPISNADAAIANTLRFMLFSDGTGYRPCEDEMRDILARFSPGWPRSAGRCRRTRRASASRPSSPRSCSQIHVVAPDAVDGGAASQRRGLKMEIPSLACATHGRGRNERSPMTVKRTLLVIDARLQARTSRPSMSLPEKMAGSQANSTQGRTKRDRGVQRTGLGRGHGPIWSPARRGSQFDSAGCHRATHRRGGKRALTRTTTSRLNAPQNDAPPSGRRPRRMSWPSSQ